MFVSKSILRSLLHWKCWKKIIFLRSSHANNDVWISGSNSEHFIFLVIFGMLFRSFWSLGSHKIEQKIICEISIQKLGYTYIYQAMRILIFEKFFSDSWAFWSNISWANIENFDCNTFRISTHIFIKFH